MNIRGERIIVFGDSTSHHSSDSSPEIWDVDQDSSRISGQPGDLLASMLLEQGASAVRVNARVGRSAHNFWGREDTNSLLGSDQAFAPTKVIMILGTNDIGLSLDVDQADMERIRDFYKGLGAEVWGVGPWAFPGDNMNQGAMPVADMMKDVFGARFIDPRPITATVGRAGDGVHFGAESARQTAMGLLQLVQSASSFPWKPLLLGLGAAILGAVAWNYHKKGKIALPSLGDLGERCDPNLSRAAFVRCTKRQQRALGSADLGALPKDVAAIAKKLNAKQAKLQADWRTYYQQAWSGDPLPDLDARKAEYERESAAIDEILVPLMPPRPKPAALKAARDYAKKIGLKGSPALGRALGDGAELAAKPKNAFKLSKVKPRRDPPHDTSKRDAYAALERERQQMFQALNYAGNTREQVTEYHARIKELDAKIQALDGLRAAR